MMRQHDTGKIPTSMVGLDHLQTSNRLERTMTNPPPPSLLTLLNRTMSSTTHHRCDASNLDGSSSRNNSTNDNCSCSVCTALRIQQLQQQRRLQQDSVPQRRRLSHQHTATSTRMNHLRGILDEALRAVADFERSLDEDEDDHDNDYDENVITDDEESL